MPQSHLNYWVNQGIAHKDKFCILLTAKELTAKTDWHHNAYKIWVMHLAASYGHPHGQHAYNALLRAADHPDTHLYVRCALSVVQSTYEDEKESYKNYEFVATINRDLPNEFLQIGRRFGFCTEENEALFYRHQKHFLRDELDNAQEPISRYFLRRK